MIMAAKSSHLLGSLYNKRRDRTSYLNRRPSHITADSCSKTAHSRQSIAVSTNLTSFIRIYHANLLVNTFNQKRISANPNLKATFTELRNLMRNFSTFSLVCLFYLTIYRCTKL